MRLILILFAVELAALVLYGGEPAPQPGKDLFQRRCSGCHSADSDKEGPRLRGVLGRQAGSVAGFPYSGALRGAGFVWDENRLNKWLENPQALVRDNDMEFRVSNAEEREALVAYLKSLGEAKVFVNSRR